MRFIGTSKRIDNMPKHSQEKCQLPQHANMHAHTSFSRRETWGNGIDRRKQEKCTGQKKKNIKCEAEVGVGRLSVSSSIAFYFTYFSWAEYVTSPGCFASVLPNHPWNTSGLTEKMQRTGQKELCAFQGPASLIAAAQYFNQYSEHNMPADKTQHVWQVISSRNTVTFSLC